MCCLFCSVNANRSEQSRCRTVACLQATHSGVSSLKNHCLNEWFRTHSQSHSLVWFLRTFEQISRQCVRLNKLPRSYSLGRESVQYIVCTNLALLRTVRTLAHYTMWHWWLFLATWQYPHCRTSLLVFVNNSRNYFFLTSFLFYFISTLW